MTKAKREVRKVRSNAKKASKKLFFTVGKAYIGDTKLRNPKDGKVKSLRKSP